MDQNEVKFERNIFMKRKAISKEKKIVQILVTEVVVCLRICKCLRCIHLIAVIKTPASELFFYHFASKKFNMTI